MNLEETITITGLIFDIIGVGVLFFTTSAKNVEAEMSVRLVAEVTEEISEWTEPYSFEEHKRSLAIAEKDIRRNQLFQRLGLILIVLGFILQAVGIMV